MGAVPPDEGAALDDADRKLLRRMAAGDTDALRELYTLHGPGVFSYVWSRLGSRRLAEEVLQDVMLAAWQGAGAFRGECRVRTWLFTIAHHRAVNARRGHAERVASGEPGDAPEREIAARIERTPDLVDLRAALESLPVDQRTTLELVFAHGLALSEVAQITGVAPGTVKSRLHRAKRALRRYLSEGAEHE